MKGIPFKSKQTPKVFIDNKLSYEELIATYTFSLQAINLVTMHL